MNQPWAQHRFELSNLKTSTHKEDRAVDAVGTCRGCHQHDDSWRDSRVLFANINDRLLRFGWSLWFSRNLQRKELEAGLCFICFDSGCSSEPPTHRFLAFPTRSCDDCFLPIEWIAFKSDPNPSSNHLLQKSLIFGFSFINLLNCRSAISSLRVAANCSVRASILAWISLEVFWSDIGDNVLEDTTSWKTLWESRLLASGFRASDDSNQPWRARWPVSFGRLCRYLNCIIFVIRIEVDKSNLLVGYFNRVAVNLVSLKLSCEAMCCLFTQ